MRGGPVAEKRRMEKRGKITGGEKKKEGRPFRGVIPSYAESEKKARRPLRGTQKLCEGREIPKGG